MPPLQGGGAAHGVLTPQISSRGRLEIYGEAWDLFLPKAMAIVDLKAAADPAFSTPEDQTGDSAPSLCSGCE